MNVFQILITYHTAFERGFVATLELASLAWVFGIVFGVFCGVLGHSNKQLGNCIRYLYFITQSIPAIIIMFWVHYPLQELLGVSIYPFITAGGILILINTISISKIIMNALDIFPKQYAVAGEVCGLSKSDITKKINIPIIFRSVFPEVLSQQVSILQMTVFASFISVEELFRVAQQINSQIYRPIEIYSGVALFFIAVCLPITLFANRLRSKYARDYSEK
jgi:ABC-type amino acid transport system permease subunit